MEKTILVSIGEAGYKILSGYKTDVDKLYIDTDKDITDKYNGLLIGEKVCKGRGTYCDIEKAEKAVDESKNEILNKFNDYENIVLIVQLGGETSSGATKKIVELLRETGKKLIVITSIPLEIEDHRHFKAINTILYVRL